MKCEYYECKKDADVVLITEVQTLAQSLSECADHAYESMLQSEWSIHKLFYFEKDRLAYDVTKKLI